MLLFGPLPVAAQQPGALYELRFGRNRHALSSQHERALSLIADTLLRKSGYVLYINGHADSDADSSYNQRLSLQRSLAVKEFLLGKGISDSVIRVRALGEEQPLVENRTPLGKARNRRVELLVLFRQAPRVEPIEPLVEAAAPGCAGDTTVTLEGGYTLTVSRCDWQRNGACLRVERRLTYTFKTRENWLKKHLGFKNYLTTLRSKPRYEFYVRSCTDSCFRQPVTLYIPHYQAPALKTSVRYAQPKENGGPLLFRNTKLGDSAYYVTGIHCPGRFSCGTDNRCLHPVRLHAKSGISLLSYSYYVRGGAARFDSLVEAAPGSPAELRDNYRNAFFHTLVLANKGDTITLRDIPRTGAVVSR